MKTPMLVFALVLITVSLSYSGSPPPVLDTEENRIAAARHYVRVAPMKTIIDNSVGEMAKNLPEDERAQFVQLMTKAIRIEVLQDAAVMSLVKHYTASEINALAEFYGSRVGQSILKKLGKYMADVMPVIQREIIRAANAIQEKERREIVHIR
jgi:hypothetical protein